MNVDDYLGIVLKSGEEKETNAKWYYGKMKNAECYGFIFNIVINEKNVVDFIPTVKNYAYDDDLVDVINDSIRMYKCGYESAVMILKDAVRMLKNASGKIG